MVAEIVNLDRYGLDLSGLKLHSDKEVSYCISLSGPDLKELLPLEPKQRLQATQSHLRSAVKVLRSKFDFQLFSPRHRLRPWQIDVRSTVRTLRSVARSPFVTTLHVDGIKGLRKARERAKLEWYSVRARVAIQVEGQVKGLQKVEDRIVMVRAYSFEDAQKRLEAEWEEYAKTYINLFGELVRWQLEEVEDVFAVLSEIEPKGTEVWSSLRNRRMRKDYEWHGE